MSKGPAALTAADTRPIGGYTSKGPAALTAADTGPTGGYTSKGPAALTASGVGSKPALAGAGGPIDEECEGARALGKRKAGPGAEEQGGHRKKDPFMPLKQASAPTPTHGSESGSSSGLRSKSAASSSATARPGPRVDPGPYGYRSAATYFTPAGASAAG
jgi:hypothetical protein